jgi:hypothetical protein
MPSLITFATVGVLVYLFVLLLMWGGTRTKTFRNQPVEHQARVRRQFKQVAIWLPILLVATHLLLLVPPEFNFLVPVLLYLGLWVGAGWLLWRSFRLGVGRDTRLVKSMSGRPLQNPERYLRAFSRINLITALYVICVLVAIPAFSIKIDLWAPLLAVATGLYSLAVSFYEKRSAA